MKVLLKVWRWGCHFQRARRPELLLWGGESSAASWARLRATSLHCLPSNLRGHPAGWQQPLPQHLSSPAKCQGSWLGLPPGRQRPGRQKQAHSLCCAMTCPGRHPRAFPWVPPSGPAPHPLLSLLAKTTSGAGAWPFSCFQAGEVNRVSGTPPPIQMPRQEGRVTIDARQPG